MKKPWVAVLLNLFPLLLGLGYLYVGRWKRFLAVAAIQLFSLGPLTAMGLRQGYSYLLAAIWLISLIDVYAIAKRAN